MDKLTFEKLISSPFDISSQEAGQLEGLLNSFPYCQAAYILIAKESHDKKSMLYPQKLRKASTYSLNRKVLHHLIFKKSSITEVVVEKKNEISTIKKQDSSPQKKLESNIPVVPATSAPDNSNLLQELEENMRLLKKQRHLYDSNNASVTSNTAQVGKIDLPEIPNTSFPSVALKKRHLTPLPTTAPLFIEETKLGEELSSEQKQQGSELEMLLAYLFPPVERTQQDTIDKFIEKDPKISKATKLVSHKENDDLSKPSTELKIELTTENYAQILVKQNKIEKAKEVYRKLILKYPDKSAYFAAKIHELDNR